MSAPERLPHFLVILLQPAGKHLAIFLMGINEASVAAMPEQMPLAVRDVLVKRGSHNGSADVECTAAY